MGVHREVVETTPPREELSLIGPDEVVAHVKGRGVALLRADVAEKSRSAIGCAAMRKERVWHTQSK